MSIALAMNTKNEAENLRAVFNCFESVVSEIVVVDCNSTDGTRELAKKLGARVYNIGECPGFGSMRTITAHLCRTDWVIIIDGDERMDPVDVAKLPKLTEHFQNTDIDAILLPRQHYRAWDRSICENPDLSAYADWQCRLVRVDGRIHWVKRVHEEIRGIRKDHRDLSSPVIKHFGYLKTPERPKEIKELCDRLWKEDSENKDLYVLENLLGTAGGEKYWQSAPEYHANKPA